MERVWPEFQGVSQRSQPEESDRLKIEICTFSHLSLSQLSNFQFFAPTTQKLRPIYISMLVCMTKSIEMSMIAIAFAESIMQMGKLPLFAKGVLDERHYTVDQKWCLERKKYVAVGKTLISLIHPLLTNHHYR